jgi:hypothetical protein
MITDVDINALVMAAHQADFRIRARKMSWFGFGGSSEKKDDHSVSSMKIDDFDSAQAAQFDNSSSYGGSLGGSSSVGASSMASLEQQLMAEQQKVQMQMIVFKLTESAFEACITKPSSSLSSSEKTCLTAIANKYLDTQEVVTAHLQRGQR